MDRVVLVGADDVLSGGRMARNAGTDMERAASTIQSSLETHQRYMEEWLVRFEQAIDKFDNAVAHMN